VDRQIEVLESGGTVVQETRGWSEAEQRTFSQRSKEFAEDYRYFPEPDLPPLEVDGAWIDGLRAMLPRELPSAKRARYQSEYALSATTSTILTSHADLPPLFEVTILNEGAPPKATANWIVEEVAPTGKIPSPKNLAELVKLVEARRITRDQGREVLMESVETGRTPAEIVAEHGYAQVSDESELRIVVEAVIDANPKAAADFRGGKKQAMQALMADLRKRAPQANPKVANDLLLKLLG
ncbi:MAG TPA: Asp-tRNA(Asn)/Glu-tRNA(Gln) amidotransferase GatCAB subunit B, partial [Candidatus Dormibacteraeota bacterium]|nr:Asp-tRNA(Asn)/Glu-tRNA(Gln) amidotransferase GatCAB subunit B [Candidatus Dormibacteraeota bacterium]